MKPLCALCLCGFYDFDHHHVTSHLADQFPAGFGECLQRYVEAKISIQDIDDPMRMSCGRDWKTEV
jgi:hypothetical protein